MLRDITLGQYYQCDSVVHKLDPRVKFVGTLVFVASLFTVKSYGYLICGGFLLVCILISEVPFGFIVRGLRPIIFLLLFTAVLNLLLTPGEVIFKYGIITVTRQGIRIAALMALRFVFLILGSSLLTLTTTPAKLTEGLERLFSCLKRIKVPVEEVAMMMSIALRFIPILIGEANKIIKAQSSRGADFEQKNVIKKAKALIPVLIPLFVSAFNKAEELAQAMEARCYGNGIQRTHLRELAYSKRDYMAYMVLMIYLVALIVFRVLWGF